ncbi:MAG: hypothetical protein ACI4RA_00415 [Kiritimatiellia bacterium]
MKKILCAVALAAVACGCITVNKNDGGNANIRPNIVKDKIHEKYTVGQTPVSATDNVKCLFGFICWGSTATHVADCSDAGLVGAVAKAKNGAYANACDAGKCDAIVGTRYTVTTDDYFVYQEVKAEVKGYPANVTSVEVIPADAATPVEAPIRRLR